jgi:hypothetical protein
MKEIGNRADNHVLVYKEKYAGMVLPPTSEAVDAGVPSKDIQMVRDVAVDQADGARTVAP